MSAEVAYQSRNRRNTSTPQPNAVRKLRETRSPSLSNRSTDSISRPHSSLGNENRIRLDSLIFKAVKNDEPEAVYFLLKQAPLVGLDANMSLPEWDIAKTSELGPMTLLARTCYTGDLRMAMLLYANGAEIDFNDGIALRAAVASSNIDMVRFLLELGASLPNLPLDSPYKDPIDIAIEEGNFELVQLLIGIGGLQHHHHLLVVAAAAGHKEMVSYLLNMTLSNGEQVLLAESEIGTAVQTATIHKHWTIVRMLLDRIHDPPKSSTSSSFSDCETTSIGTLDNPIYTASPEMSKPTVY